MISLTTDFGLKDFNVSAIKASIYKELPDVNIVDVSHEINPFDLSEASYIIRNAYHNFPKGSVHIVGVDSAITPNQKPIIALIDEHYFLSANNGILSLLGLEFNPTEMIEIQIPTNTNPSPILDVFVPAACHIIRGGKLSVIGKKIESLRNLSNLQALVNENDIIGTVIYIDNFGNVVTNINKSTFEKVQKKRNFNVQVRNHIFDEILTSYTDVVKDFSKEELSFGKGLVLFNRNNYLEVSIYKSNPKTMGSASSLFGLKKGDTIKVTFY